MLEISRNPDGITLQVRVSPGASRDRVMGEHAGALKVAVSAAPEKGKANKALCALLAKKLGLPRSAVEVVSGDTSRDKKVLIRGIDPQTAASKLVE